tara:strand:- start:39 stop:272 length:234 start_codon:yes stop_codon:yes gene_type:complete
MANLSTIKGKNKKLTEAEKKKMQALLKKKGVKVASNKLTETHPGMLTSDKMPATLRRLGIDPQKLVDEEYSWKTKGK